MVSIVKVYCPNSIGFDTCLQFLANYPELYSVSNNVSKFIGTRRLFLVPPSIRICLASSIRPCLSIHRGESGRYLFVWKYHCIYREVVFQWESYLIKNIKQRVGSDMPIYSFHHSSKNNANIGKMIKPIDQKNSNTNDVIIFAAPFVISITEIIRNGFVSNYNYWKVYLIRMKALASIEPLSLTYISLNPMYTLKHMTMQLKSGKVHAIRIF